MESTSVWGGHFFKQLHMFRSLEAKIKKFYLTCTSFFSPKREEANLMKRQDSDILQEVAT